MSAAAFLTVLLAYVLQSTLILASGLLLVNLLRARDPFFRLPFLVGLFWASLFLPLSFLLLPAAPSGVLRPAGSGLTVVFAAASAPLAKVPPRSGAWLVGLLLLPSALLLARLVLGLLQLRRLAGKASPLPSLPHPLKRAMEETGTQARFGLSDRLASPVTFGWIRPIVLLPPASLGLEEGSLYAVSLHEMLHIRRRHFLQGILEETAAALFWFHPALRLVLREIHLLREQWVDLSVVRATGAPRLYLNTIAAMARLRFGTAPVFLQPFLHRGHLKRRLALLTKEVTMTKRKKAAAAILLAAAVLLTGAFAATRVPLSPAGPGAAGTPGSAESPLPPLEGVYEMGALPSPNLLERVDPVFPPEAKEKGLTGKVILEIVILESERSPPSTAFSRPTTPSSPRPHGQPSPAGNSSPPSSTGRPFGGSTSWRSISCSAEELPGRRRLRPGLSTSRSRPEGRPYFFSGSSSKVYMTPSVGPV